MRTLKTSRKAAVALALAAAFSLSACQAPAGKKLADAPAPAAVKPAADAQLTQRDIAQGLYELAYSPAAKALWVASAEGFNRANGGVLYRLDPVTLATQSVTHTDLKNFGLVTDADGNSLYVTNTVDGSITHVDAQSGKVLQRLAFKERSKKGDPLGVRQVIWHNGLLYVGGAGDPGVIWVVDAQTLQLKNTLKNVGRVITGLLWSEQTQRLYAANANGEILVINPRNNKVEQRWTAGDGKSWMFLNLAEDPATGRLFATDNSKGKATLVFDERSGQVIKRIEGDALGIKFNARRNEIYLSQRGSKRVQQLDATSYAVKNSWSFNSHPNSLEVSPDGQTLYVSLKQPLNKQHQAEGDDSVVRIALK